MSTPQSFSFVKSKPFLIVVIILCELILLLSVFRLGMLVGFKKANFSFGWGENYHKMFGGPRGGWLKDFGKDDYINSNGIVGNVIGFASSTLTIRGIDNVEKSVLVNDSTVITLNRDTLKPEQIQADDRVMVIGSPLATGEIEAKYIRIMPTSTVGPMMQRPMLRR